MVRKPGTTSATSERGKAGLLATVNADLKRDFRESIGAEVALDRKLEHLRERAHKRRQKVFERSAKQLGIDLAALQQEHERGNELRARWIEADARRAQSFAKRQGRNERHQRVAIKHLQPFYGRKKKNPGENICLNEAAGHDSDAWGWGPIAATASFESVGANENYLELNATATSNARTVRRDWTNFIWDAPEEAGVATISAFLLPRGRLTFQNGSDCNWFGGSGKLHLYTFMRVTQVGNSGLATFGEATTDVIPLQWFGEGQALSRALSGTLVQNYPAQVPIRAGNPVVISIGIGVDAAMSRSGGRFELDLATGAFRLNYFSAYVRFEM